MDSSILTCWGDVSVFWAAFEYTPQFILGRCLHHHRTIHKYKTLKYNKTEISETVNNRHRPSVYLFLLNLKSKNAVKTAF